MLLVKGCVGAGSLGKSSRVSIVLCVRFRSSIEKNKATADTRYTEPPHGVSSSTPCDRLSRDMLEDPGSALYRRLKGLGRGDPARSPTPTYKNVDLVAPSSVCCVGVLPGSTLAAPPPRGKRPGIVQGLYSRRRRLDCVVDCAFSSPPGAPLLQARLFREWLNPCVKP